MGFDRVHAAMETDMGCGEVVRGGFDGVCAVVEIGELLWVVVDLWIC